MALHHECEGDDAGFDIWDDWSMGGNTYPGTEGLRYQWESFRAARGKRLVTMATVIKMANEAKQKARKPFAAEELKAPAGVRSAENGEGQTLSHFTGKFPIYRADDPILQRPLAWLIKGVLPWGDLGILYGQSGSGKTFVALDMAMALVRGVPWRGHRVPKPVRVQAQHARSLAWFAFV